MKTNSLKKRNYVLLAILTAIILLCIGLASSPVTAAFAFTPETAAEESVGTLAETQQENSAVDTVGSIAHGKGLGRGINVLTATEYNTFTPSYALDAEKLETMYANKNMIMKGFERSESSTILGNVQLGSVFGAELGADVDFTFINAGSNALLSGSAKLNAYRYKYYNVYNFDYKGYELELINYDHKETYLDNFSNLFLNDLDNVVNGSMTEKALFASYGTHIVGSAIYGGKLSSVYTVASNKIKINSGVQTALTEYIDIFNAKTFTNTNVVSKINSTLNSSFKKEDITSGRKVLTQGGGAIPTGNNLDWCKGNGLKDWYNRINNNDEANVLIGYDEGALVPIWNILPEKYNNIATKLKNTFTSEYSSCYNKFKKEIYTDNTTDYAGGDGSFAYPYQIKTVAQLKNVALEMEANFILMDDINLSGEQWEPIGGYYCDDVFSGVFDGNSKIIKNLTRSNDIEERNNRIYFGLFCEIGDGGLVKNLNFSGLNIKMTGPAVNNASTWVYVGAVAASVNKGSIENCKVDSGTCSYDVCTNGEVYTGAICGRANDAKIRNCSNAVNVTSGRYTGIAGGICGYAKDSEFYNCKNTASVTSKCTAWGGVTATGGIVGMAYKKDNKSKVTVSTTYCNGGSGTLTSQSYGAGFPWTPRTGRLIGYEHNWVR